MAKAEWGVKRQCANCGARFYDLGADPAVCPECGAVFAVETLARVRGRRVAAVYEAKEPVALDEAELIDDEDALPLGGDEDEDDVAPADDEPPLEADIEDDPIEADDAVLLEEDDADGDDALGDFGGDAPGEAEESR
jgi:uncharacterized protein (TIGR02300 family)